MLALLFDSGKGVHPDLSGAGSEQDFCALTGCGACSKDIIDKQKPHILCPFRSGSNKSPLDIILSRFSAPALGFRRPHPTQEAAIDRKTTTGPELHGQKRCLIKTSRSLALRVERNRH